MDKEGTPPGSLTIWERILRYFIGHDFFISYSHHDQLATTYAPILAGEISKRKRDVHLDQWGTDSKHEIPPELKRILRLSRVLVVIGSESGYHSLGIGQELDLFKPTKGYIIPIDLGQDINSAVWWEKLEGLQATLETNPPGSQPCPSEAVINRVLNTHSFLNGRKRRSWSIGTALVLLSIAALAVATSLQQVKKATEESARQNRIAVATAAITETIERPNPDPLKNLETMARQHFLLKKEGATSEVAVNWLRQNISRTPTLLEKWNIGTQIVAGAVNEEGREVLFISPTEATYLDLESGQKICTPLPFPANWKIKDPRSLNPNELIFDESGVCKAMSLGNGAFAYILNDPHQGGLLFFAKKGKIRLLSQCPELYDFSQMYPDFKSSILYFQLKDIHGESVLRAVNYDTGVEQFSFQTSNNASLVGAGKNGFLCIDGSKITRLSFVDGKLNKQVQELPSPLRNTTVVDKQLVDTESYIAVVSENSLLQISWRLNLPSLELKNVTLKTRLLGSQSSQKSRENALYNVIGKSKRNLSSSDSIRFKISGNSIQVTKGFAYEDESIATIFGNSDFVSAAVVKDKGINSGTESSHKGDFNAISWESDGTISLFGYDPFPEVIRWWSDFSNNRAYLSPDGHKVVVISHAGDDVLHGYSLDDSNNCKELFKIEPVTGSDDVFLTDSYLVLCRSRGERFEVFDLSGKKVNSFLVRKGKENGSLNFIKILDSGDLAGLQITSKGTSTSLFAVRISDWQTKLPKFEHVQLSENDSYRYEIAFDLNGSQAGFIDSDPRLNLITQSPSGPKIVKSNPIQDLSIDARILKFDTFSGLWLLAANNKIRFFNSEARLESKLAIELPTASRIVDLYLVGSKIGIQCENGTFLLFDRKRNQFVSKFSVSGGSRAMLGGLTSESLLVVPSSGENKLYDLRQKALDKSVKDRLTSYGISL